MWDDQLFMNKLANEIEEVKQLDAEAGDIVEAGMYIEDYQPFSMNEICGDMQDNEAIAGLSKTKDQMQDEMEQLYAQMGL